MHNTQKGTVNASMPAKQQQQQLRKTNNTPGKCNLIKSFNDNIAVSVFIIRFQRNENIFALCAKRNE